MAASRIHIFTLATGRDRSFAPKPCREDFEFGGCGDLDWRLASSYVISDILNAMTAGELLRTVRRRHGLTQRHLADRARTSQAAISRIERGTVSPTVDTLATLLDLMGEEIELGATPIDYGHDRTLNANNLRLTVEERIQRQTVWGRRIGEIQRAIRS
jgi:transcriptional regulator with XRE-family HTH domain